jgi:hypothetical protein
MHGWLFALIWFALGTFLGPWLLAMVTGKSKQAA